MDFIIFDLEATCWEGNILGREQEIIEIGALHMDGFGDVFGTFQSFVRPVQHPQLSVYCRRLTGIDQQYVDAASGFDQVIIRFRQWIDDQAGDAVLCSWGSKDYTLLTNDLQLHNLPQDWLPEYIDIKQQYHDMIGARKKRGLKRVLEQEGIPFTGDHHRALDDASNLSILFRKYLDRWMY
ncbi:MAG: 3'-5' exonuclease [Saprospiraceae bacterium]|nr:3'-5' exonuclease [Saprospiraceae bacterium]